MKVHTARNVFDRTKRINLLLRKEKSAPALLNRIFDPSEWKKELVDTVMPVLAVGMAQVLVAQCLEMGVDVRQSRKLKRKKGGAGSGNFGHSGRPGQVGGSAPNEQSSQTDNERGGFGQGREALEHILKQLRESGGFTYSVVSGNEPKEGFALSIYPEHSRAIDLSKLSTEEIAQYIGDKWDVLKRADHYLGGWVSEGKAVLDVSVVKSDLEEAKQLAIEKDQVAVFDLKNFAEVVVNPKATSGGQLNKEFAADGRQTETFSARSERHDEGELCEVRRTTDRQEAHGRGTRQGDGKAEAPDGVKRTRASEFLERLTEDLDPDELDDLFADLYVPGDLPIGILTEIPTAMKQRIADGLRESFSRDYWQTISETTGRNAETVLRQGLQDGWSIREMADAMEESLGGDDYAKWRATNIARTESCGALNGSRKAEMDALQEDLPQLAMKAEWLSVLGTTTRPSHADLDGVPADEDGLWELGGVRVPYPGHPDLDVSERSHCQCSIAMSYGMQDDEAAQLIADYYKRQQEEMEAGIDWLCEKSLKHPGHPDQSVHNPHGQGDASTEVKPPASKPTGGFKPEEWGGIAGRERFGKLSANQRDVLADASNNVPRIQQEHLAGMGERPSTGDTAKDISARLAQASTRLHPNASARIENVANHVADSLVAAGASKEAAGKLAMEATDSLIAQEMEACTRQLGDHGIHHITGNIAVASAILSKVPGIESARDEAVMTLANVFHDMGYMTPPSQSFLDQGHARWSADHFNTNVRKQVEEVLGRQAASEIEHIIRTHDSTDINWQDDPIASACRVADNLSLFHREKLPPVLRYVPENVGVLERLGAKEIDVAQAKTEMRENLAGAKLPKQMTALLDRGIEEIGEFTPKYTLGMLGGEVKRVDWKDDALTVTLKESEQATRLNKIGDFGQRQFAKFAEAFVGEQGIERFKTDLSFDFKRDGKTVLRGIVEKLKELLARLRIK